MRRDKGAWTIWPLVISEPRQEAALIVQNAHAGTEVRPIPVAEFLAGRQLGHVEAAATQTQPAGPVEIAPFRLVFAVTVEHLDPMIFAVGNVNPAAGIAANVVHYIELARSGAR